MRIALAQANAVVGDIRANSAKALELARTAKRQKAEMIIFPELFLSGYPPEDLLFFDSFISDTRLELELLASKIKGITAIVGFPCSEGAPRSAPQRTRIERSGIQRSGIQRAKLYNSAAVISDGRIVAVQHKRALPNYGVFDEKRYFEQGRSSFLFETAVRDRELGELVERFKFGVTICEDIWVENGPHITLCLAGADLIINLSSSPYHTGKWDLRRELLSKRSAKDRVSIVYVNLVGGQDELVFDGRSMVVGPDGELIAVAGAFTEDLMLVDIPCGKKHGRKILAGITRSGKSSTPPGIQMIALNIERQRVGAQGLAATHAVTQEDIRPPNTVADDLNALCLGLRDYFLKNRFEKAIIGLSGGIDSALTAVIAVMALGAENVMGVMMPSRYSSAGSIADSKKLAKNLGMRAKVVKIDDLFTEYLDHFKKDFRGLPEDITEQNLQARIRGNILMAYANKFGYLVLATGNKSELGVGYSTLYGDMVGGFAVIKDVFKTRVYEISQLVNERAGYDIIPSSVIKKAPSAELKPDQRDDDDLPDYDTLDRILALYIEQGMHYEEITALGFDPAVVKRVLNLVDNAEYKRRQGPVGVKISPRAFGKDRRMPITNRYKP